jgi:hypothetical protein
VFVGQAGDPEVGQLGRRFADVDAAWDDHVLRLDVAMHDPAFVGVLECAGKHGTDRKQHLIVDAAVTVELRQRAPLDELRDEIVRRRVVAAVVQLHDRRVVESSCGPPLALDPRLFPRVVVVAGNPLYRHASA